MIVLKILGIALAVIILLITTVVISRLKIILSYGKDEKIKFRIKVLCFTFGGEKKKPKKKKKKKESKFVQRMKKKLGLDVFDGQELKKDAQNGTLNDKVSRIVALVMMFAGQIKWLFSKLRLDKLSMLIVCGGKDDAADAAVNYGLVCAAVYPMAGYLTSSIDTKVDASDIRIGCDFDGENRIDFDLVISIRIYHLLTALMRSLSNMAVIAEKGDIDNEQ